MKLFDLFEKRADNDTKELEIYSGMRVVVESLEGEMLFIAKLQDPLRDTAVLLQYSEAECFEGAVAKVLDETAPLPVKIRGYNEWECKAVFMEGRITSRQTHVWQVESLNIIKIENERSSLRVDTMFDAVILSSDGDDADKRSCKLLNISVGGAGISSKHRYYKGDKFLLKVKLLEDKPSFVVYCEVLRVVQRDTASFEYGCQFLELTEDVQNQLARYCLA